MSAKYDFLLFAETKQRQSISIGKYNYYMLILHFSQHCLFIIEVTGLLYDNLHY